MGQGEIARTCRSVWLSISFSAVVGSPVSLLRLMERWNGNAQWSVVVLSATIFIPQESDERESRAQSITERGKKGRLGDG